MLLLGWWKLGRKSFIVQVEMIDSRPRANNKEGKAVCECERDASADPHYLSVPSSQSCWREREKKSLRWRDNLTVLRIVSRLNVRNFFPPFFYPLFFFFLSLSLSLSLCYLSLKQCEVRVTTSHTLARIPFQNQTNTKTVWQTRWSVWSWDFICWNSPSPASKQNPNSGVV